MTCPQIPLAPCIAFKQFFLQLPRISLNDIRFDKSNYLYILNIKFKVNSHKILCYFSKRLSLTIVLK